MAENKSPLQALLSGEMLPLIPLPPKLADYNELHHYLEKLHDYIRRLVGHLTSTNIFNEIIVNPPTGSVTITYLTDYRYDTATKKFQKKTRTANVLSAGVESGWVDVHTATSVTSVSNWQYDATTHQFQYKTIQSDVLVAGAESAWTAAGGSGVTSGTFVSAWRYDTTTHQFQKKTRTAYVFELSAESGWTAVGEGTQPTSVSRVVRDVNYSTTTHVLSEDHVADVYVLEKGADTNGTNIDTAEVCV